MKRQTLPRTLAKWCAVMLILLVLVITGLKLLYPFSYRQPILAWAEVYQLDPHLILSVIRTESHFRPEAVSSAGAIGLMQIMPTTGAWVAEKSGIENFTVDDLYNPQTNIRLGSWYLHYLIGRFVDIETALAAYNAGPGAVDTWGKNKVQMYPETAEYIRRVRKNQSIYRNLYTLPIVGPLLLAIPN